MAINVLVLTILYVKMRWSLYASAIEVAYNWVIRLYINGVLILRENNVSDVTYHLRCHDPGEGFMTIMNK